MAHTPITTVATLTANGWAIVHGTAAAYATEGDFIAEKVQSGGLNASHIGPPGVFKTPIKVRERATTQAQLFVQCDAWETWMESFVTSVGYATLQYNQGVVS